MTTATILVHVQPRARRTEIVGRHGDALKIRVAAPPEGGAANAELLRFLAERLRIPRGCIRIAGGSVARRKRLAIVGVDALELVARLTPGA